MYFKGVMMSCKQIIDGKWTCRDGSLALKLTWRSDHWTGRKLCRLPQTLLAKLSCLVYVCSLSVHISHELMTYLAVESHECLVDKNVGMLLTNSNAIVWFEQRFKLNLLTVVLFSRHLFFLCFYYLFSNHRLGRSEQLLSFLRFNEVLVLSLGKKKLVSKSWR